MVLSENAIHSGTAVSASEKLWIVSAASAIDPDIATTTVCAIAVAPSTSRLSLTARMPAALSRFGAQLVGAGEPAMLRELYRRTVRSQIVVGTVLLFA